MHVAHHIKCNIDWLYLSQSCVVRGFLSLVDVLEYKRHFLARYLCNAGERLLLSAREVSLIKDRGTVDDYITESRQCHIVQWKKR